MNYRQKHNKPNDLLRYAGLGAQIFVSLGIAVFAGYKADKWVQPPFPCFSLVVAFYCSCINDL
jgi:hypothetical protein